jgi:hypothetical protein
MSAQAWMAAPRTAMTDHGRCATQGSDIRAAGIMHEIGMQSNRADT